MLKKLAKNRLFSPIKISIYLIGCYERLIENLFPNMSMIGRDEIIKNVDADLKEVVHKTLSNQVVKFSLYTPNRLCNFRHNTFSSKEPEMLKWIEEFGGGGAFYDIGANIGIYSIYHAKIHDGKVYSFEPSAFNLRQLSKNISKNNLHNQITIIPNPLSNTSGIATFTNGSDEEGGALSAFGVDHGYDGKPIRSEIKYNLMGFSLDDLFQNGSIPDSPSIIKIDVDGIEHLILKGAKNILRMNSLKSVFVEVNDDFQEQSSDVKKILREAGFSLSNKLHSDMMDKSEQFNRTYNQIWIKEDDSLQN